MTWEVYLYPDGSEYEGEWLKGKRHGYGVWTRIDGMKYEGEWFNDKPNGFGTLTYPDGKACRGDWANGKFLGKREKKRSSEERLSDLEATCQRLTEEVQRLRRELEELEQLML